MKKVMLYIITLATTLTTVYFALVWEPNSGMVSDKIGSITEQTKNEKKEEKSITKNEEVKVKEEKSTKEEEKPKESKVEIIQDNNAKEATANVSFLKMKEEDILDSISLIDKAKLVKIGYKLQTVDRKKIEDWVLYSPVSNDGARKAFNLLKSRLSSNDFNELEEILTPYVNFEVLGDVS